MTGRVDGSPMQVLTALLTKHKPLAIFYTRYAEESWGAHPAGVGSPRGVSSENCRPAELC
jgi:hypothetical protein